MDDAQQHRLIAYGAILVLTLLLWGGVGSPLWAIGLGVVCLFAYELQELYQRDRRRKRRE